MNQAPGEAGFPCNEHGNDATYQSRSSFVTEWQKGMLATVAVTDTGWYEFLKEKGLEEVNFWKPSDRKRFNAPAFSPFLFKLKKPANAICGYGFFARWSSLPDWLAWDLFGYGNGCESIVALQERITTIRNRIGFRAEGASGNLGCILITQPVFFSESDWIRQPTDWPPTTQSSRPYDTTIGEGRRIWEACVRLTTLRPQSFGQSDLSTGMVTGPTTPRYGTPSLRAPRLGQKTFRVAVLDAYSRACAVTTEHSLPTLEAVHVQAYASGGPHEVRNGILLRADLHRLFDKGYITVTAEHRLEVSNRLRDDFSNGKSYYPLHGKRIDTPKVKIDAPSPEFLDWHRNNVYRG